MIRPRYLVLGFACSQWLACNSDKAPPAPAPAPAASASAALTASAAPAEVGEVAAGPKVVNKWGKEIGLKNPESVIHDVTADVYFVSNVQGKPLDADGHGFIAKVAPEGTGVDLRFIVDGKNDVKLNAPKGMALTGDTLWVADIDTVRLFHRTTGMPQGEVKVPGATFLNDVAVGADGKVLISDTGTTGNDAVYAIDPKDKKVSTIAKSKELGGPNGLLASGDKVIVVTFGSGEIYGLDSKGVRSNVQKLPAGQLDGVAVGQGDFFVSSWEASAVLRGKPGGKWGIAIPDVKSPADILFDRKRNRLVVPMMNEDEMRAYEVK
jgi:sugar lactone lactonase YvrE